jgi:alkanesulfonate monooxygenase SsuD/methylene tetrahydromethanopterin reductase-like flavin-dependent oxidoreductase (luciferase family)
VAKAATAIDNATGGRFVLGLGAGWHEGEHAAFGIPLPPMAERFARYESAVATLAALFSDAARRPPGVTRDDPFYPLEGATLAPAPIRAGGPALWLGGQRERGITLAARYADGWIMPGTVAGSVGYFIEKREAILRALEAQSRDPDSFSLAGQVEVSPDRAGMAKAREIALGFIRSGANHVTLGIPGRAGPSGLATMAREVAEPIRQAVGRP